MAQRLSEQKQVAGHRGSNTATEGGLKGGLSGHKSNSSGLTSAAASLTPDLSVGTERADRPPRHDSTEAQLEERRQEQHRQLEALAAQEEQAKMAAATPPELERAPQVVSERKAA